MNETDTLMLEVLKLWNTVLNYEQLIKGYVCQRCWKKLNIHFTGHYAIYVKGVKSILIYTIRAVMLCMLKVTKEVQNGVTHFAHHFLNNQQIFNAEKVFECWDSGLSSHVIKYYMLKHVEGLEGYFDLWHLWMLQHTYY